MAAAFPKSSHGRARRLTAIILTAAVLVGCAGNPAADEASAATEYDPWETMNRRVYNFNVAVDKTTLKPLAKGYKTVMPRFARRGITNFLTT